MLPVNEADLHAVDSGPAANGARRSGNPGDFQLPPETALALLSLHDDLQRIILKKLDLENKISASQVCRDWRRLLVTDCDQGAWGELTLEVDLHASDYNDEDAGGSEDCKPMYVITWKRPSTFSIRADRNSAADRGAEIRSCLEILLGGPMSRRFADIIAHLPSRYPTENDLVRFALGLLSSASFRGRFLFDEVVVYGPADLATFLDTIRAHPVVHFEVVSSLRFRLHDDMSVWLSLEGFSSVRNLKGLGTVGVIGYAGIPYSRLLANLPPFEDLRVAASDTGNSNNAFLSQFTALSGLTRLRWEIPLSAASVPDMTELWTSLIYRA